MYELFKGSIYRYIISVQSNLQLFWTQILTVNIVISLDSVCSSDEPCESGPKVHRAHH